MDKETTLVGIQDWVKWECSLQTGYYVRDSCILMRWLYDLDLGNGLDDIGIGSVYQCDTLTERTLTPALTLKVLIYISWKFGYLLCNHWYLSFDMCMSVKLGCACFLNIWHFSPEHTQTWSLGATESEVWIGNFNVKAGKTTWHKLHKI